MDALAVLAIVALWFVAQSLFLGGLSENRAQATLYRQFRSELAAATAPTGGVIDPGKPVALLKIPHLGIEPVVVEGTASGDLLAGPGHRRDTVLPGQEGVSLVYGRARTYGAPFGDVTKLVEGQRIVARTAQGRSVFRVDGVRRAGDPIPKPLTAGQGRLTLVSAEGRGAVAALAASSTVYVDATLVGKAFAAPAGRPAAVPESEHSMGIDTSALPMLVLCFAAVIALVAWIVVARQRRPAVLVWVVTAPVVLALAWASTDVAMRLLPNLL
jgi:sortase A